MYNTIYLSAGGRMLTFTWNKIGPRIVNRDNVTYFRAAIYPAKRKAITSLKITLVQGNECTTQDVNTNAVHA